MSKRRRLSSTSNPGFGALCMDVLSVVVKYLPDSTFLNFALSFSRANSACRQSLSSYAARTGPALRLFASANASKLRHFIEVYPPFAPGEFSEEFATGVHRVLYPKYSDCITDICFEGRKSLLCDLLPALSVLLDFGFHPRATTFRKASLWGDLRLLDLFGERCPFSCYCMKGKGYVDLRLYMAEYMRDNAFLAADCNYGTIARWILANGMPLEKLEKIMDSNAGVLRAALKWEDEYESVDTMEVHLGKCDNYCTPGNCAYEEQDSDDEWSW